MNTSSINYEKEAATRGVLYEKCARVSSCRPEACNFIKKETLAQVVSCEFCEISKNTFVTQHLWKTASDYGTTFWHCLANTRGK